MAKSEITYKPFALALETSGRVGSVAVGCDGKLSDEKTFSAPLRHSAELFDTTIELLKKFGKKANQIRHIYISIGPGSFTGIRISVTVAKMMALAAQSRIVAVGTTDAMALNVNDNNIKKIATVIDAKREQFFIAAFERKNGIWQKTLPDCLKTAEQFRKKCDDSDQPIWLLGEGLLYYAKKFETANIKILDEEYWSPRASNVFRIGSQMAASGNFSDPVSLVPFYLRRPEAEENWEKKTN
jgi:tRNA threonylcarbamoyladenosine biosynthesis protein TsaB